MQNVQVKKAAVLERLHTNRDAHRAAFERALEGYHEKVIANLASAIEQAKKSGKIHPSEIWEIARLPQPEDHTRDYDLAIDMLAMEVRDDVELTQQEYRNLVRDEWDWKERFLATNASYGL